MKIPQIDDVLRSGMLKSMVSLLIKVATAGLTYLMFVALARAMDNTAYGLFAFGFALATMLSVAAAMGQQTAILRFWPEEEVAGRPEKAMDAARAGWSLVLMGSVACGSLVCLVALILGIAANDLSSFAHLFAAALLILPMAAAEYSSSLLRAQGSVWTALLPRDIFWRVAVPAVVWALYLFSTNMDGTSALLLTALLLAVALGVQFLMALRRGYKNPFGTKGLRQYWAERGKASRWFFAGTVVDTAALNIDIVLVGLFVTEIAAGIYFNAFRTAALMTLFMFAITLVVAPIVARHYHAGEMRQAQIVATFNAWAGFLFSLVVFAIFFFFGDLILSLFGEGYAQGTLILLILSVGLLADAATGPTRIVMMMTGHERDYVRIFGIIIGLGLLLQFIVIPIFGLLGAALVNAGSRIVAQFAIAYWTRRNVGIDTSLIGLLDLMRGRQPNVADRKLKNQD